MSKILLSDQSTDKERYARQFLMPEIGETGQQRLCAAKVLVIGVGGLGSPVLTYLALAGVGHLSIVDAGRMGHLPQFWVRLLA
jgi:molybdopterin/thiamine biosynthesis adenylyltransferase